MTVARKRRNNAPVRPPRPATTVPDLVFAMGMALLVMAVVFFVASFVDDTLSNGDAGTVLARVFAGTLFFSAVCAFLLGLLLLRGDRNRLDHYVTPLALGAAVGGLESWLFLRASSPALLLAPLVLLVFALRPVRRALSSVFRPARQGRT